MDDLASCKAAGVAAEGFPPKENRAVLPGGKATLILRLRLLVAAHGGVIRSAILDLLVGAALFPVVLASAAEVFAAGIIGFLTLPRSKLSTLQFGLGLGSRV